MGAAGGRASAGERPLRLPRLGLGAPGSRAPAGMGGRGRQAGRGAGGAAPSGGGERGAGRVDAGALPGRLGAADGFIGPFGSDAPSADSLSDPNTRWPPTPDPAEPPNISQMKSPARHIVRCADAGAAPRHSPWRRGRAGVIQHRAAAAHPSPEPLLRAPAAATAGPSRGGPLAAADGQTHGSGKATPSSPLSSRRCRRRGSGGPLPAPALHSPAAAKSLLNSLGFQPCALYL